MSSIYTERNHLAYRKQKKSCHWPVFPTRSDFWKVWVALGSPVFLAWVGWAGKKKRFWDVDHFVVTDINGSQIVLWFSQIFMKYASRNTRIRLFLIIFFCKRKFWLWLFNSLFKEIIIPSSFLIFLIQYGVQPIYCFLYFLESILKTEYLFTGLGLRLGPRKALCSATNSIVDFREKLLSLCFLSVQQE